MSKLVVSQFITLDGVIEDPGGSEGFERGGWAFQFERGAEGDRFKLDELTASDVLLLGRVTFEGFAAAWPSRTGDFADKFNTMRKYVVSTTLDEPGWSNSTVIKANVPDEVAKLKAQPGGDILVNGSVQLVRTLLEHDLVDELRLMVFPVILGAGKRLFGDAAGTVAFKPVETKPAGSVAILTLERTDPSPRPE
jgi:dihydrofolate reductase